MLTTVVKKLPLGTIKLPPDTFIIVGEPGAVRDFNVQPFSNVKVIAVNSPPPKSSLPVAEAILGVVIAI